MKELVKKGIKTMLSRESRTLYKISKLPRYTKFTTTVLGSIFEGVDPPSFIAQYDEQIRRKTYKFNTTKESPYIIDCGVNIGLSVISLKNMYPKAKIIGFEPDPNIKEIADKNIKNAGYFDVELLQKAVWTEETTMTFFKEGSAGGKLTKEESDKTITVETFDLKKLLTKEVDFLKIDIEGAEFDVIKDINKQLHLVKNIFLEYHSKINEDQNLGEILDILKSNGFKYFVESGYINPESPLIERIEIDGFDNLINIFGYRI